MSVLSRISFVLLLAMPSLQGQTSLFRALTVTENLCFEVTADWNKLWAIKQDKSIDATLLIPGFAMEQWDIEVKVRGKARRRSCDFPPLELNFKKKKLEANGYARKFDKFKLVTHCIPEGGEQNLAEEMLVYELYGLLTPRSFALTHGTIVYKDSLGVAQDIKSEFLLLEPNKEIEARLEGKIIDRFNFPADSLDTVNYNRMALFQFMVGNTDWDHGVTQNVKIIKEGDEHFLIPYDFDYSSIVMPPYARLSPDLGIKDFRDRVYLGKFFSGHLAAHRVDFAKHREGILAHVEAYPFLKKARKRAIAKYLKSFFDFISNTENEVVYKTVLPFKTYQRD